MGTGSGLAERESSEVHKRERCEHLRLASTRLLSVWSFQATKAPPDQGASSYAHRTCNPRARRISIGPGPSPAGAFSEDQSCAEAYGRQECQPTIETLDLCGRHKWRQVGVHLDELLP